MMIVALLICPLVRLLQIRVETHLVQLGEKQKEENIVALNSALQSALLMFASLDDESSDLLYLQVQSGPLSLVEIHQDCALVGWIIMLLTPALCY